MKLRAYDGRIHPRTVGKRPSFVGHVPCVSMSECIAEGERWGTLFGAKKANHFATIKADQHFDFAASLYLAFDVEQAYEEPEDLGYAVRGWIC